QRVRAGDVAERKELEQVRRRGAERSDRRAVKRIADTHALQRAMQRIAQRHAESGHALRVVLQGVQHILRQIELLVLHDGKLLRLVVVVAAAEDAETQVVRLVKKIRLSE